MVHDRRTEHPNRRRAETRHAQTRRAQTRGAKTRRLLEPRSIAVVGASPRPDSFGERMMTEVLRSPASPQVHLVNPGYAEIRGVPCVPTLAELPAPVDLVMLGVPDQALEGQLELAAGRGDSAALIFGPATGKGPALIRTAMRSGMALCGGGCMGYLNVSRGIRALGYIEPYPLEPGPIALISHSGSVFSALLRTRRRLGFSVVVSAGQELVTTTSDYLHYALELPETRVVGLFLETLRDVDSLRAGLAAAAELDVPVVALTVGGSPTGRALVNAHSGALAGDDAAWEALFSAYGVHRVQDLDEMVDTLELFAVGRRVRRSTVPAGLATLHDSGGERALVADLADTAGVRFAELSARTRARLADVLDPSLEPANPLDVWGTGRDTYDLFTECMSTLADDDAVDAVVLSVDVVTEYDGDNSYPLAVKAMLGRTTKPLVVLSNVTAAVDQTIATALRAEGVPVLEGTRSGLRALRHLLDDGLPPPRLASATVNDERRARWTERLTLGPLDAVASMLLLSDYGIPVAATVAAGSATEARLAADAVGYPVVVKTDALGILHKVDLGGVVLGVEDEQGLAAAYETLSGALGPRVVVQAQAADGIELALGIVRDPLLGPMVMLAVGGTLVELIDTRSVALPPLSVETAEAMIDRIPVVGRLLDGVRGRAAADRAAVVETLVAVGELAVELGDAVDALDINPVICGPSGLVAVDALVIPSG